MPDIAMTSESEAEGVESVGARALGLFHPAATIFLGAFLLFQVQPLLAKEILPWFGGSAAVWTVCMLFFQLLLLGGYLYAHGLARCPPRVQAYVHGGLLLLSLLSLPLAANPAWRPTGGADPTLRILGLLLTTVGLPYLLLASTSPLLQAWIARARPGYAPYRLFSLSNFGSMLALLSYPMLVEPNLRLTLQGRGWSALFLVYVVLAGALAWRLRHAEPVAETFEAAPAPAWDLRLFWIALAAGASLLLLAVTSHLSTNVAPIPFLWVLPLTLYLLSFILCFESGRWYRRAVFLPLLAAALVAMVVLLSPEHANEGVRTQVLVFGGGLFIACMVAHGELASLRPHPRHLTGFYLCVSIGGALGGIFAGIVAPQAFHSLLELPLGLALMALLAYGALVRNPGGAPLWARRAGQLIFALGTGGLLAVVGRYDMIQGQGSLLRARNFYGALRVRDVGEDDLRMRLLLHGTINHGGQFLDPARARIPAGYYSATSGLGRAIQVLQARGPMKVGILGLGSGSLLGHARAGDTYRIYEINPLVERLARSQFTMLPGCPARTEVIMGDGRLSLEREPSNGYDLMAIDAFSSDSIPVHLLTREAIALYRRQLRPGGILAVHITNRYLDLEPVLKCESDEARWPAELVSDDADDGLATYSTDWVLFSEDGSVFSDPLLKDAGDPLEPKAGVQPWTDDYSNLFRILK
ncbi:MAG TPA: fused MFS/spermidine synthase [Holophagaceae bacterium]|nr:fused MFS/spermidine synthase [Holophagaceae bacterium]